MTIDGTGGRDGASVSTSFTARTGRIEPGQQWRTVVPATIPSPAIGTYVWQVTASGFGPAVLAETHYRTVPWLLLALTVLLTGVVVMVVVRFAQRRASRRRAARADRAGRRVAEPERPVPPVTGPADDAAPPVREPIGV
jgi:chloramphenicol 3-O-phosphotransferase